MISTQKWRTGLVGVLLALCIGDLYSGELRFVRIDGELVVLVVSRLAMATAGLTRVAYRDDRGKRACTEVRPYDNIEIASVQVEQGSVRLSVQ